MKVPSIEGWKPELEVSAKIEDNLNAEENWQYELNYKAGFGKHMKRKRGYEENYCKAYAEIWERCNKVMKAKIDAIIILK